MKNIQTINEPQKVVASITCDVCNTKVEAEDVYEFQEMLSIQVHAGYGSILGDGNHYELDLCQKCILTVLGLHLRLKYNYITGEQFE